MSNKQIGRFSKYIRAINSFFDLLVLNSLCFLFFDKLNINYSIYIFYQTLSWLFVALLVDFYAIFRFSTLLEISSKLIKQFFLTSLLIIAFFPFSKNTLFSNVAIVQFLLYSFLLITIFKFLFFLFLKEYRKNTKNNLRRVIIIGFTKESKKLKEVFKTRTDYGYEFLGFFSNKYESPEILGKVETIKEYVVENKVDEIYCSMSELRNEQIKDLIHFSHITHKTIKFIPDTKEIFSKNLKIDYYEIFPILSIQKTTLNDPKTRLVKRVFDITFSLIVIVFVLSWLVPLLSLIIKIDSRGPVFYKQGRPGLDEKEFFCYKFRSMKLNKTGEKPATKNDPRITKTGKIIRKTSLDEMPQFFNVLFGDMSIVGPRPHLWSQNNEYGGMIEKYMLRHCVKPGITGLAQVKGFRGEIESKTEMINRVKYDVFYLENWSFLLDLKIIFLTVYNIIKGEPKAY